MRNCNTKIFKPVMMKKNRLQETDRKKSYQSPMVTIIYMEHKLSLLNSSNEGLNYEDMFSPPTQNNPVNDLIINEDPFTIIP